MHKNELHYTPVDLPDKHFIIGSSVTTEFDGKPISGVVENEYPFIVTMRTNGGFLMGIPKASFLCGDARINPT